MKTFRVLVGVRQACMRNCMCGAWRVVCDLIEDICVTMRLMENHYLRWVHAVDLRSWRI